MTYGARSFAELSFSALSFSAFVHCDRKIDQVVGRDVVCVVDECSDGAAELQDCLFHFLPLRGG